MKRRGIIAGAIVGLGAMVGLGMKLGAKSPENVSLATPSGAELAADDTMLLVDIRRPEEWRQTGVVEGARLHTYAGPEAFLAAIAPQLQEGQKIGLICRTGNRTSRAAAQIAAQTDVEIVDIGGGMVRVMAEGYRPVAPTRAMGCSVC